MSFTNDPLSEITIGFESLAGDGVTLATSVVCTGPNGFNSGELGTLGDGQQPRDGDHHQPGGRRVHVRDLRRPLDRGDDDNVDRTNNRKM